MSQRPHLLHLVRDLRPSGAVALAYELAAALTDKRHTLLCTTPPEAIDPGLLMALQVGGLDVLQVPAYDPDRIKAMGADAAILYGVDNTSFDGLGCVLPCIYYGYGGYDKASGAVVAMACSEYASHYDRAGKPHGMHANYIVPPLLNAKALHGIAGPVSDTTVAMVTSHTCGKYPYALATALVRWLPHNMRMLLTVPERVDAGLTEALNALPSNRKVVCCPLLPHLASTVTAHADIVVYGTDPGHHEPYGRTVMEAMAMGKTVVCERKGVFERSLTDLVDCCLYDDIDEALGLCDKLLANTHALPRFGANAALRAARDDATGHIGTFKRVLRKLGA